MSKPISVERETLAVRWRVSFHGGHAQIERFDDGAWHRIHFGGEDDLSALVDCIDAAVDAKKGRARV